MKTKALENGSNSGRHPLLFFSEFLQGSTYLRCMELMVFHHFSGLLKTILGGIFQDNSKMDVDGILKNTDIVTTMTT